jgi:peptidyl-prolyl cis-trans isomerase D
MISWIQRSFQHHFRVIFGLLLAVVIISFIATIGATPGVGRADHSVAKVDFFGHNLASAAEMRSIDSDAQMSIELQAGFNPYSEDQVHQYALQRVAGLHLADEWHLPEVSPTSSEMTDYIKTLRIFAGSDGQFDPSKYATVRNNLRTGGRGESDIARVLSDDIRFNHVNAILAGPGFVQPSEVKAELLRSDTTWTIATAEVEYASFHPPIAAADAQLETYFKQNALKYQIPARVVESYVLFPILNYLPAVKTTDAEVRAYYDRDPSRFPKPTPPSDPKAKAPAPVVKSDPAADYAAVRPQVESALKLDKARNQAAHDASDFAFSLYQGKVTAKSLPAYLGTRRLSEKTLPPFTSDSVPAELGSSAEVAQAAFELNAEKFYSEALNTPAGAVVLLWKGNQPPRQPLLSEVKDKVKADYMEEQRQKAFADLGHKLKSQIAASVKSGQTFEKAAAAAAAADKVKITAKTLPAFKLSERPKDLNQTAIAAMQHLNPGEFSDLDLSGDQTTLVYGISKQAPDLSESSPRFAAVRTQEGSYFARLSAGEYLTQLVARELKHADSKVE